ncbi:hypothetical protein H2203_007867 [Taxawa tesnikishii (nom. ined.)]|nr:hypothetical protein H2203_007867 [Dothideales sp. JES 119]
MSSSFTPPPVAPLRLQDAGLLLEHEYLPFEAGYAINADGMHHVAASTYMRNCTGAMVDWWFGWIHKTDMYKLWHPRDHIFSDWEGPRGNDSVYVGGHHLVEEYIGGEVCKLKISFRDPSEYFGNDWRVAFKKAGYSTAVCGKVGNWDRENDSVMYIGHLIHLIKDEPDGCRMRSRFWLGDVEGITEPQGRADSVPKGLAPGLLKHATEEMAILATILPLMHSRVAQGI